MHLLDKLENSSTQRGEGCLPAPWGGVFFARILFFVAAILFFQPFAQANNISVSNVSIASRSASADTATVQFDISWANSWRNRENYDAAWVFVKYSIGTTAVWSHATLKTSGTNPTGFSTGSGTSISIVVPTDKKGAFIQRSDIGSGSLSTTSVKFVWDYGTDGISDSDTVTVKVFATEMVYIPTASFYLGDGVGGVESSRAFHVSDNTTFQVTTASTANVTVDSNADDDIDTSPISIDGDGGITGNASFPTGYLAFYLMKYEISEGQWVDFYNTLTATQQSLLDITSNTNGGKNSDSAVNRNTIAWTSGNATTTRVDRAMSYLSWMDGCAFADWAALRPMTELEFEKAARGPLAAVSTEYVWGTTALTAAATISGSEGGTETITTASANANYNTTTFSGGDASTGPLRVGIFATSSSIRLAAGAGYYGVMELSGNLNDRCVNVGNSTGRAFTGTNGDGALDSSGYATNSDWPGYSGGTVIGSTGSCYRGGAWNSAASVLRTSDRSNTVSTSTRSNAQGFRAARTA